DVDQLADIGLVPLGVEVVEAGALWQDEALALEAAANAGHVVAILLAVGLEMVVPEVRNVLQEQHDEDVVLVLAGIDGAPEGVAGRPGGLIDLLLGNLIGHQAISFWSAAFAASPRMALTSSSRRAAS